MAATLLTLILVRKTVIINEAFRTGTGEIVYSIDTCATIVAWRGAAGVQVYLTVLALNEIEENKFTKIYTRLVSIEWALFDPYFSLQCIHRCTHTGSH